MNSHRFVYQENQYWGSCIPCTASVFDNQVRSAAVARNIGTRQAIEKAVREGLSLDEFLRQTAFREWSIKQENRPRAGEKFASLSPAEKLLQWAQKQKNDLPSFVFGVMEFGLVPMLDKDGNPKLDKDGKTMMYRRRKQENILHLSGLFMSDFDHLPFPPKELFERTKAPGFPWKVRLAHVTSSGFGLRLVCEWDTDAGNIADNQYLLARELGMLDVIGTTGKHVTDNSCINADRISYCPRYEDILHIDEDKLFNF